MSRGGHQDGRWYARAARHKRQNPVCLCCWSIGRTRAAEVADHVIPVTSEGGSLLAGELQSCCRGCHDSVKRKLEQLYSQGKCRVEDLKLDSPLAKKLRRQQRGEIRYGVNGRPLDDPDDGREPLPPLTDWVRIDGKEEPATTAPARTLPRHLAAALARQKAWKPA
jgi:HNH endonuclease